MTLGELPTGDALRRLERALVAIDRAEALGASAPRADQPVGRGADAVLLNSRGNALGLLQRIACNNVDRPVGSLVYTQFLNKRGGVESDLTVCRLAADRFRVITGTSFLSNDLEWVRAHAPTDGSVELRDVTDELACIGLWGPAARDALGQATDWHEVGSGAAKEDDRMTVRMRPAKTGQKFFRLRSE